MLESLLFRGCFLDGDNVYVGRMWGEWMRVKCTYGVVLESMVVLI